MPTGRSLRGLHAIEALADARRVGFYGVTPVVQPSGVDQAAVTLWNTDGEIGGPTISDPPTQAEVHALRDKAEELADDVRALSALVDALRGRWLEWGWLRGTCSRHPRRCGRRRPPALDTGARAARAVLVTVEAQLNLDRGTPT